MADPFDLAALVAHLKATWGNDKTCPMCGHNNWVVPGQVSLGLADGENKGIVIGGPHLPCATVVCDRCGFTALVNLIVAGVVKRDA